MEGGNEPGSFVWELLIWMGSVHLQPGPQAAALLSPCASEKSLLCSSLGLN